MKWVGASIAAAACICLGFGMAGALSARSRTLENLVGALGLLSQRIVLLCEPIWDALQALSGESPLFKAVLAHRELAPPQAWKLALGAARELNCGDRAIIEGIIAQSGASGRAEQEAIFAVGIGRLREREAAAKEKAKNDARLYRTLGFLAAAAVLLAAL